MFFCVAPIQRITVRATWLRMPNIDRETFQLTLRAIQHRRHATALSWLASMPPDLAPAAAQTAASQTSFNY